MLVVAATITAAWIVNYNKDNSEDNSVLEDNLDGATSGASTIPPEDVAKVSSVVDTTINLADPQALAENSNYIALVCIDSLDGADNYSEISQQYVLPYTFGQMTVLENYKGELMPGEKYGFYRLGGTLPAEQYYAGALSPEANAKRQTMQAENGESDAGKYVRDLAVGDIEIEAGKTYLAYLVPESSYYGKPDTYAIIGYQGGLREARQRDDVWQVLNNFTGEWEDLAAALGEV